MKYVPIDYATVKSIYEKSGLSSIGQASIREVKKLIGQIEEATGEEFVKMEMGIPGLPAMQTGVDAQIEALQHGVAALYPDIQGIPELKNETSRFIKLFLNVDVAPESCIPTVGSMMAGMAIFMTVNRMYPDREGTLFIDPCFPVQKQQCKILGHTYESFDVYNYRGDKLREKIESYLKTGKITSILYSNPNNPAWFCFTEDELKIIGELADKYDVIVIEDLAYFGMDFRKDYSKPGVPPYQPTVAKYTKNFILFISSSKIFSYAGERIGSMVISEKVWNTRAPGLKRYFSSDILGNALVFGSIYALSSGTSHSAQYALAAMMKAVNDGEVNYRDQVIIYGEKAKVMKKIFTDNGFKIVYDKDLDEPIADGFYFTVSYPGMTSDELLEELLYYGVSAISLSITGSEHTEGLRACTSLIRPDQFPVLEERLKRFHEDHK
ncbi:MAG: pyridoxal phosphate-dependent aminotransferase [Bacteroidales bacterium]|jgi:aspartate/methionine/tyrosine aminotransferase|nr:pyridoxal phosphate-dependent aminotransferase [Bacteroidales bacterium]